MGYYSFVNWKIPSISDQCGWDGVQGILILKCSMNGDNVETETTAPSAKLPSVVSAYSHPHIKQVSSLRGYGEPTASQPHSSFTAAFSSASWDPHNGTLYVSAPSKGGVPLPHSWASPGKLTKPLVKLQSSGRAISVSKATSWDFLEAAKKGSGLERKWGSAGVLGSASVNIHLGLPAQMGKLLRRWLPQTTVGQQILTVWSLGQELLNSK